VPRGKTWDALTLGRSRRRRRMHRQLNDLDRWYAAQLTDDGRSGDGLRRFLVGTATVVVALLATVHVLHRYGYALDLTGVRVQRGAGPAASVQGSSAYRFAAQQPGSREPVTYDACRPIDLVVDDEGAPSGSGGLVRDAVEAVGDATGLTMVVDGSTDERASASRPARDPQRYGSGWSPVLVAWTTPEDVQGLSGDVVGLGGSTSVQDDVTGRDVYVTGDVALDSPALGAMLHRPQGRAEVRAVVMHELGHVVGLTHVDDPDQLMYPDSIGLTSFGPGDLAGLAALGRGRCS